jgi:hypothetical protein
MPNGKFHQAVGTTAGGAASFIFARARPNQPIAHTMLETIGGCIAGNLGARAPDVIDPPTSPRHRGIAHGVVPVGAATFALVGKRRAIQENLRDRADRRAVARHESTSLIDKLGHLIAEIFLRIAAGAVVGFGAGYLSHLAFDATTPARLPLFC